MKPNGHQTHLSRCPATRSSCVWSNFGSHGLQSRIVRAVDQLKPANALRPLLAFALMPPKRQRKFLKHFWKLEGFPFGGRIRFHLIPGAILREVAEHPASEMNARWRNRTRSSGCPELQFPDAAEDPGSNGIPRLLEAVCAHDMGDLSQGRHVFACACRCSGGGSGGVCGERSFGVGPAT
jgi:hypothetical protein